MKPPYNCVSLHNKTSAGRSAWAHRVIGHDIAERVIHAARLVHQSPNRTRQSEQVMLEQLAAFSLLARWIDGSARGLFPRSLHAAAAVIRR